MREPVIAADGQTYERSAIEDWFAGAGSDPLRSSIRGNGCRQRQCCRTGRSMSCYSISCETPYNQGPAGCWGGRNMIGCEPFAVRLRLAPDHAGFEQHDRATTWSFPA